MTDNKQYADSEGNFGPWRDHPAQCTRLNPVTGGPCGALVQIRTWESSDGGFVDYQYRCTTGHVWWIDGIDS